MIGILHTNIAGQQNLIHFISAASRLKAALLSSTIPIEILDKSSGALPGLLGSSNGRYSVYTVAGAYSAFKNHR